ncbi:M28 family peptidase [Actinopolymorpha alba]|uniref:M28 family peptidase n=1 Tax=Actinopolymorpha alba TaxID=533267 RepID=UPI00037AB52D|nr:M28 family peptidase [Actinopolymorpha alba]
MPSINRRDLLTGAAALAGLTTVAGPTAAHAATRTTSTLAPGTALTSGDRKVLAQVSAKRALTHLEYLSDEIGPRIGGTPSEMKAAKYLAARLRDLGYRVTLQPFPVADKYLADLSVRGEKPWQAAASGQGRRDLTLAGQVVDGGAGGESDYPADVRGAIVLLQRGTSAEGDANSAIRVNLAIERGAAAVLLVNISTVEGRKAGTFTPVLPAEVGVPVIGVAQYHGERLRARLAAGSVKLTLTVTTHANLTSHNVIAERPPSGPSPDAGVVMVSAHYDSVIGSPGGNDDGSGTVLTLEVARALKSLPTRKTLRFALWGSEEQGLIGSTYYVDQLDDAAAGRIVGCFQNDMVATSWGPAVVYYLLSVDGLSNTTTDAVAAAAARLGYASEVRGPVLRGSSDHVPFHNRGIAAGNFSWRGAGGPAELEPIYHTPEDTIALNVSTARLQKSLELIGTAAYALASS